MAGTIPIEPVCNIIARRLELHPDVTAVQGARAGHAQIIYCDVAGGKAIAFFGLCKRAAAARETGRHKM